jgi:hypothetical protein
MAVAQEPGPLRPAPPAQSHAGTVVGTHTTFMASANSKTIPVLVRPSDSRPVERASPRAAFHNPQFVNFSDFLKRRIVPAGFRLHPLSARQVDAASRVAPWPSKPRRSRKLYAICHVRPKAFYAGFSGQREISPFPGLSGNQPRPGWSDFIRVKVR